MQKGRMIASGAVTAVLTWAMTTAPAAAADGVQRANVVSGSPGSYSCALVDYDGTACFESYGEWFWVKDTHDDRVPVAIKWSHRTSTGALRSGVIYNDRGPSAGWTAVNKSFEEDLQVSYYLCDFDLATFEAYNCWGPAVVQT